VCVVLCVVFRLIVVLFCVMCYLCLIVVPLPPGKNLFAVKINNIISFFYLKRRDEKLNIRVSRRGLRFCCELCSKIKVLKRHMTHEYTVFA
jgi:hypothetical protein